MDTRRIFSPTKASDFKTDDIYALKQLYPYLKLMSVRVVLALTLLILAKFANVGVPIILKEIVDSLDKTNVLLVMPLGLLFAYGGLRLLASLFNELRDAIFAKVRYHSMRLIAINVFKKLHDLDLAFHLSRKTGGINRDIVRGTQSISTLLSIFVFNILPSFFEVFLVIGLLLFNYDIFFALISLTTVVFYVIITLLITQWRMKYRYMMNEMESDANSKAVDSLINFETVKYFNNEDYEAKRYDATMDNWESIAVKSFTSMTALNFVQGGVIAVGVTIILILATEGVVDKTLSLGDMIMIQALLLQLFLPLGTLGIVYRQIKHNFVDMNNVFSLLKKKSKIADAPNAKDLIINNAEIAFQDVDFHYQQERQILKNISFKVNAQKKVAIVGPSGSGKSTIARLLFRFYDIINGQIIIDGQNVAKVNQKSLRENIGIVPQDSVMFNDSIFYNIAYAKPDASIDEVARVAKLAAIDEFIESLPQKYETIIGERGLKLSGGERQRLAIARVLLKNPPILIFDEATSSLDSKSEKDIQQALNNLSHNHTTIVIAHRLSTIIDAYNIVVLDKGEIKEQGTHKELLEKQGLYFKLWQIQHKK